MKNLKLPVALGVAVLLLIGAGLLGLPLPHIRGGLAFAILFSALKISFLLIYARSS